MEPTPDAPHAPTEADIAEAVARLVRAFDPLRIDVFGSVARGTAGPHSDLDLLVVLGSLDRSEKRAARVHARRVLAGLGVPVDVLVTSPLEIVQRGWIIGTTLHEALRESRTVYAP
ncbi:nucleotidyltransferase domain-containing protein [Rubrivirga sp.]|uniref:nucleotidyltransferase domain-containing protein n=1 Tax=Rubrivirga sp. TaxID=1885344 RepID=UPI003B5276BE